jgi:hypothetical protein
VIGFVTEIASSSAAATKETTTMRATTATSSSDPPPREDPEAAGEVGLSLESRVVSEAFSHGNSASASDGNRNRASATPLAQSQFGAFWSCSSPSTRTHSVAFGQKSYCRRDGNFVLCLEDMVLAVLWVVFLVLSVVTSMRDGSVAIAAQVIFGVLFLAKTVECHLQEKGVCLVAAGLYALVILQLSALTRSELPFLAGVLGPLAATITVAFVWALCQRARADKGLRPFHAAESDTFAARWRPRIATRAGRGASPGDEEAPAEAAGSPSSLVQP